MLEWKQDYYTETALPVCYIAYFQGSQCLILLSTGFVSNAEIDHNPVRFLDMISWYIPHLCDGVQK